MTNPKPLINGSTLSAALTTYYTAPANVSVLLKKLTFANFHASAAAAVTVYVGSAADNSHMVWNAKVVANKQSLECFEAENHILAPGDTIQINCDTATAVAVKASGIELT